MKEAIRKRAEALGFDSCRFTSAEPPPHKEHFERWLQSGCHGEMGYLQRNAHKRVEPNKVLSDARTIITLAASYASDSRTGPIARYARFMDYHHVLGERLKVLSEFIAGLAVGSCSLWYVDAGPFLERDLAQRAGLGFIGKHTNLISRELGNWFFLAEIITTLEIEPDAPEKNRCGTCSRCITACPTAAITAPYQLDARLCISYLTIELKGPIPEPLRPLIGNRIYGCDDCLQICPWNRFAREGRIMKEHARPDLDTPDLLELLALDDAAVKRKFAGTPIMRTKRRGLLRNVCVALGNVGDLSVLPALEAATRDNEPLIADHAEWAIDQIKSRELTEPAECSNRANH